jgi:hypothetical protein
MVLYLIIFEGISETCTVTGINVTEDTVPVPELPNYKINKYSFMYPTVLR